MFKNFIVKGKYPDVVYAYLGKRPVGKFKLDQTVHAEKLISAKETNA